LRPAAQTKEPPRWSAMPNVKFGRKSSFERPVRNQRAQYRAVDEAEVSVERQRLIDELVNVLGGTPAEAEENLRATAWDLEDAVLLSLDADAGASCGAAHVAGTESAGAGETDAAAEGAGTVEAAQAVRNSDAARPWDRLMEDSGSCVICFSGAVQESAYTTDCGAVVCGDCCRGYARAVISDAVGASAAIVICPMPRCQSLVPMSVIATVLGPNEQRDPEDVLLGEGVSDADLLRRYQKFQVRDFVNRHTLYRQCPAPDCGRIFTRCDDGKTEVICVCGHQFCFQCSFEPHFPVSCSVAKEWLLMSSNDAKSQFWVMSNTRFCPQCHVPIVKDGGCSNMQCTRCKHSFTWKEEAMPNMKSLSAEFRHGLWKGEKHVELLQRTNAFYRHAERIQTLLAALVPCEARLRAKFGDDDVTFAKDELIAALYVMRWVNVACVRCDEASYHSVALIDELINGLGLHVNDLHDALESPETLDFQLDFLLRKSSSVASYRRNLLLASEDIA
jgi:IBR domain, a half RING-finger domain